MATAFTFSIITDGSVGLIGFILILESVGALVDEKLV